MSMVVEPVDGREMVRQLKYYDGIFVTAKDFGRLEFTVDVANCRLNAVDNLVDELNAVEGVSVFVSTAHVIDFDYYVTADLVPIFRGIVDAYADAGARVLDWFYGADYDF